MIYRTEKLQEGEWFQYYIDIRISEGYSIHRIDGPFNGYFYVTFVKTVQ